MACCEGFRTPVFWFSLWPYYQMLMTLFSWVLSIFKSMGSPFAIGEDIPSLCLESSVCVWWQSDLTPLELCPWPKPRCVASVFRGKSGVMSWSTCWVKDHMQWKKSFSKLPSMVWYVAQSEFLLFYAYVWFQTFVFCVGDLGNLLAFSSFSKILDVSWSDSFPPVAFL